MGIILTSLFTLDRQKKEKENGLNIWRKDLVWVNKGDLEIRIGRTKLTAITCKPCKASSIFFFFFFKRSPRKIKVQNLKLRENIFRHNAYYQSRTWLSFFFYALWFLLFPFKFCEVSSDKRNVVGGHCQSLRTTFVIGDLWLGWRLSM